jgi:hypothetical protein
VVGCSLALLVPVQAAWLPLGLLMGLALLLAKRFK